MIWISGWQNILFQRMKHIEILKNVEKIQKNAQFSIFSVCQYHFHIISVSFQYLNFYRVDFLQISIMSFRGRSSLRTLRAEGREAGKAVTGEESVGDDTF